MLIKIKNLNLTTTVGVYDWERDHQRQIKINAEIETGHEESSLSDDLSDTIDYDIAVTKVKDLISKNHYKLVEKMCAEVLNILMSDLRVKRCKVEIDKIEPIKDLGSFSVTIEKFR